MMQQGCKFQCLKQFNFDEDTDKVLKGKYEALEGLQHDVPEKYHILKEFVGYLKTLLWATPYWRGDFYAANNYDVYLSQLKRYNKLEYTTSHRHDGKALKDWLTHFPKLQAHKKMEPEETEVQTEQQEEEEEEDETEDEEALDPGPE